MQVDVTRLIYYGNVAWNPESSWPKAYNALSRPHGSGSAHSRTLWQNDNDCDVHRGALVFDLSAISPGTPLNTAKLHFKAQYIAQPGAEEIPCWLEFVKAPDITVVGGDDFYYLRNCTAEIGKKYFAVTATAWTEYDIDLNASGIQYVKDCMGGYCNIGTKDNHDTLSGPGKNKAAYISIATPVYLTLDITTPECVYGEILNFHTKGSVCDYGDILNFTTKTGIVYPTEALTRVTSLIHRWTPGSYLLTIGLGDLTADFDIPDIILKPKPIGGVPTPGPGPGPEPPPEPPAPPVTYDCQYQGIAFPQGSYVCMGPDKYVCFEGMWRLALRDDPECIVMI